MSENNYKCMYQSMFIDLWLYLTHCPYPTPFYENSYLRKLATNNCASFLKAIRVNKSSSVAICVILYTLEGVFINDASSHSKENMA